jgi:hypothetical protein
VSDWNGDNPFCLMISRGIDNAVIIDLDQQGWSTTYADWMRGQARWFLVQKADMRPVLWMNVLDGEQPYYVGRHIGIASMPSSGNGKSPMTEVICFGIGKKRLDGHTDRLWILPNGAVTLGDDVEVFALDLVRASVAESLKETS